MLKLLPSMTGTPNQISWAELIKVRIGDEFDRVSSVLIERCRPDIVTILEDKRREVLANDRAGYFIQTWSELNGQVRRMIMEDPRYNAPRPQPKE
jgi:hypothetical protein